MDKWVLFKNSIDSLFEPNHTSSEIKKRWWVIEKEFKNYTPNHLLNLLKLLEESKIGKKSKVLDHGCGTGLTLFFLASKGYNNIWGIDVDNSDNFVKRKKASNKIFKLILNSKKNRINNYNGKKVDFKSAYFDCIFSQQVIEHVRSKYFESYISEEKRILKTNGFALHQIPHRLGPFEGHTKKWFIHWLPKNIYYYILRNDKHKLWLVKSALFLRWPWKLKSSFKKYFKSMDNLVILRLKDDVFSEEYSIKERIIRKALVFLFKLPILGKLFLKLFSVFFQLELLVKNKEKL